MPAHVNAHSADFLPEPFSVPATSIDVLTASC